MIYDVIIAGGGPVGLLAANYLARSGRSVLVLEKLDQPVPTSRAIGVTPPSLSILKTLGLDQKVLDRGVKISHVQVYGDGKVLGEVGFRDIPGDYPFILSVPQGATEEILGASLGEFPRVVILRSAEWSELEGPAEAAVLVSLVRTPEGIRKFQSRYILACDGARSQVREILKMPFPGHEYPYTFLMGDFPDTTGWGIQARLFFTQEGAVESFPLPEGRRRWIVQTGDTLEQGKSAIYDRVERRTGISLDPREPEWQSPFGVRRHCLKNFHQGNIFFLGDAAHLMSPIGGQGMNTGFADVRDLMPLLLEALTAGSIPAPERVELWSGIRRRAFRIAADRAWRGMFLGVQTGKFRSPLRNLALRIMLTGPWKGRLPRDYAMLTIPQDPRLQE